MKCKRRRKKDKNEDVLEHERWMRFEKELAVFLGEFDAAVEQADEEDRFLTSHEIYHLQIKLRLIWENHLKQTGKRHWIDMFRKCYYCQHRHTQTDVFITLGVIRCQNHQCSERKKFNEMFNTIYTKRDIDRAREHMDELLQTPENYEPRNINPENMISGEDMERNTELKQKDRESRNTMYG